MKKLNLQHLLRNYQMINNENLEEYMDISQNYEKYHTHISSKHKFFELKLKEVWKYRDLIWLDTKRSFKVTYKQTILGPAWLFINPIIISNKSKNGVKPTSGNAKQYRKEMSNFQYILNPLCGNFTSNPMRFQPQKNAPQPS